MTSRKGPENPGRRKLIAWLWRTPVVAAAGALGIGAYEAYRVHFAKLPADDSPKFVPEATETVAPLDALAEQWAARTFTFGGRPAIALHVPEPIPGGLSVGRNHFVAFSRVCTHQGCTVAYNTDPDAVNLAFNYRPEGPALVCACHLSVFSPAGAGRAVSGPARRPLPRIALEERDGTLYAVGVESPERAPTSKGDPGS